MSFNGLQFGEVVVNGVTRNIENTSGPQFLTNDIGGAVGECEAKELSSISVVCHTMSLHEIAKKRGFACTAWTSDEA